MANIGYFTINTDGEYKTIEELTELTFTTGTKYFMQVQNGGGYLTVCPSESLPTKGGVILKNLQIFSYTPISGSNLYLKTNNGVYNSVCLNILE